MEEVIGIDLVSAGIAAGVWTVVGVLMLTTWRGGLHGGLLALAALGNGFWAWLLFAQAFSGRLPPEALVAAEFGRYALWLGFLVAVVVHRFGGVVAHSLRRLGAGLTLLLALVAGWLVFSGQADRLPLILLLGAAVGSLVLVEQLVRNTAREHRWGIKHFGLGLSLVFLYDIVVFAQGLSFPGEAGWLWEGRLVVNALAAPLVAVSAARTREWRSRIFVSRQVAFHTAGLLAIAVGLALMAAGGYYVRLFGGQWAAFFSIAFVVLTGAGLALVALSHTVRSRLKVFLVKHFYANKYDYRTEWLRFVDQLAHEGHAGSMSRGVIRALANMMDCRAGFLFADSSARGWSCVYAWNAAIPEGDDVGNEAMRSFLQQTGWVLDLRPDRGDIRTLQDLAMPVWLERIEQPWLLIPLLQGESLLGFVVLAQPLAPQSLGWEDRDLLKAAARESASHLALAFANERLVEARQFETFHQVSAYLVHDLRNVLSQLSLVLSNAERHRGNPEFHADVLETVGYAVTKMKAVLSQLQNPAAAPIPGAQRFDLSDTLQKAIQACAGMVPMPRLEVYPGRYVLESDPERAASVVTHLVRNAQEATPADGTVDVTLRHEGGGARITVTDTGCGMAPEFIRERLFRPFDSTKGKAGLGIGMHQARAFVEGLGGRLTIRSEVGRGTEVRIDLPLVSDPGEEEGTVTGLKGDRNVAV